MSEPRAGVHRDGARGWRLDLPSETFWVRTQKEALAIKRAVEAPSPTTNAGKRLQHDYYAAADARETVGYSIGARIAAIEAEATAAAEQRLAECFALAEKAILETAATERARLRREIVGLPKRGNRHGGFLVNRGVVLGLLDTPPPASPRQGEPVDGDVERDLHAMAAEIAKDWNGRELDTAWAVAEAALRASKYRHLSLGVMLDGPGYHAFVGGEYPRLHAWSQGDFPDLPDYESPPTPEAALYRLAAALSEPAEP